MLPLADIPNQENYEFTGICKDGSEIRLVIRKSVTGQLCFYEIVNDAFNIKQLQGWETK